VHLLRASVIATGAGLLAALAPTVTSASTLSGTLDGAPIRAQGRGLAEVHGVRLDTGIVAASQRVGASGRYALSLPAGGYLVVGTVMDRQQGTVLTRPSASVRLRNGQKRRVSVSVRKVRRKKVRADARAAYVQESGAVTAGVTAVEVYDFTGATGDLAFLNKGITDIIITDIVGTTAACPIAVIANARDRAAIATELRLQQSPEFDPASRVRRDFIKPDVAVQGRLFNRAGAVAYEIKIRNARTGVVLDTKIGEVKTDTTMFATLTAIGPDIAARICAPPPPTPVAPPQPPPPPPVVDPDAVSGTFSGETNLLTSPTPVPITLSWSGQLSLLRDPYGFSPVVTYPLQAGAMTATISGQVGSCAVDGTTQIDLVLSNPGGLGSVLAVDPGAAPAYRLGLGVGLASVFGTKHDCADSSRNGEQVQWPLYGTALLWTPEPPVAASRYRFEGSVNGRPEPASSLYHWAWSLSGAQP